jgi:hypothetical protein
MEAYRQIRGIWFTESLWNEVQGRTALLRRLLLSGVRLSGRRRWWSASAVRWAPAGTAKPWRRPPGPPGEFGRRIQLAPIDSVRAVGCVLAQGQRRCAAPPSLLDNQVDLFWADRKSYLAWTLGWLGAFAAGTAVLLGVVSLRFKGERRVAIWWALPVWALLCSAGLWAGGAQVLERRPRADVTEYRLAMAGWPEMHCRAVATALTFQPGRSEWTLPPEAIVYDRDYEHLDGWWARRDALRDADGLRLRLPRRPTGREIKLEAGWFEPTALALVPEVRHAGAAGPVVGRGAGRGCRVCADAGEWRQLGALKAGERRDPAAAPVVPTTSWAGCRKRGRTNSTLAEKHAVPRDPKRRRPSWRPRRRRATTGWWWC